MDEGSGSVEVSQSSVEVVLTVTWVEVVGSSEVWVAQ